MHIINCTWRIQANLWRKYTLLLSVDIYQNEFGHPWSWLYILCHWIMNAIVSVYFLSFTSNFHRKDLFYFYYYCSVTYSFEKRCFLVPTYIIYYYTVVLPIPQNGLSLYLHLISAREWLAVVRIHLSNFRFRVNNGREWAKSIKHIITPVLSIHQ